jgi:hypothetical protein
VGDSAQEGIRLPSAHTTLLYHLLFSTKDHQPLITIDHSPDYMNTAVFVIPAARIRGLAIDVGVTWGSTGLCPAAPQTLFRRLLRRLLITMSKLQRMINNPSIDFHPAQPRDPSRFNTVFRFQYNPVFR